MTNTISVPRDLLERIVGKCKLSVLGDDHAKVWELLAAPVVMPERAVIREVFMRNGFTIKEGQDDLKPYVYAAAEELLRLAAPSAQAAPKGGER